MSSNLSPVFDSDTPDPEIPIEDVDALIIDLEAALTGSEDLDQRVHFGFLVAAGIGTDFAALMIRESISWSTVKDAIGAAVPPYTTSLDAAIEGEEVIFVLRSTRHHKWIAMQKSKGGAEITAWGATEPIARRLAAIKAWRADFAETAKHHLEPPHSEDTIKNTTTDENTNDAIDPKASSTKQTSIERQEWEVQF
jgi:hypothetical protein